MNLLTKPTGEKDRALIVHPKPAVERKGIRRNKKGKLIIIDPKAIKVKCPNILIPEMKEAGHRHFYCRDKEGEYHCYGRRLNVKKTYTDIWSKIKKMPHPKLPKETVIDFELVWPGHPDSEVTTAIKECPEELRMKCFAVPIYKGESCINEEAPDYIQGRKLLIKLVGRENCTAKFKPIQFYKEDVKDVMEYMLRAAENMKFEGWVLKGFHCKEWYKLKGIQEADVFIIGFKISDAKTRKGMVTAVKVAVYQGRKPITDEPWEEVPIGNVSGFDLDEMKKMTEAYNKYGLVTCGSGRNAKPNPYMYRTMRIIYQELAGQGGLKHAFFDCWRDEEKSPEQCRMKQFD
jgi:ATP-dependent DNA ligase